MPRTGSGYDRGYKRARARARAPGATHPRDVSRSPGRRLFRATAGLGEQAASACTDGGAALVALPFERGAEAFAKPAPVGGEVVQRLHGADLELAAWTVEQSEERAADRAHLAACRSESGHERDESAEYVIAIGARGDAVEQDLAVRFEPFRMAARGLLDDVGGAPADDGVLLVEGVDEIGDQAWIGAHGGECAGWR